MSSQLVCHRFALVIILISDRFFRNYRFILMNLKKILTCFPLVIIDLRVDRWEECKCYYPHEIKCTTQLKKILSAYILQSGCNDTWHHVHVLILHNPSIIYWHVIKVCNINGNDKEITGSTPHPSTKFANRFSTFCVILLTNKQPQVKIGDILTGRGSLSVETNWLLKLSKTTLCCVTWASVKFELYKPVVKPTHWTWCRVHI